MIPKLFNYTASVQFRITNIILLTFPVLVLTVINVILRSIRQEKKAILEREKQRQSYLMQVFKAQEEERMKIAQELHDDTIQNLLVTATNVENLIADSSIPLNHTTVQKIGNIKEEIITISDELRRLSTDLRPNILDNLGLIPALRVLAEKIKNETDVDIDLKINGLPFKLSKDFETHVFRIIQEALNNIRRHSNATMANVTISFHSDCVEIKIVDNGVGCELEKVKKNLNWSSKLGLIGIVQRARFFQGNCIIRSKSGAGFSIDVKMGYDAKP